MFSVEADERLADYVVHLVLPPDDPESMFEISHLVAKLEAAIDR